jgi:hypothetical protein
MGGRTERGTKNGQARRERTIGKGVHEVEHKKKERTTSTHSRLAARGSHLFLKNLFRSDHGIAVLQHLVTHRSIPPVTLLLGTLSLSAILPLLSCPCYLAVFSVLSCFCCAVLPLLSFHVFFPSLSYSWCLAPAVLHGPERQISCSKNALKWTKHNKNEKNMAKHGSLAAFFFSSDTRTLRALCALSLFPPMCSLLAICHLLSALCFPLLVLRSPLSTLCSF